MTPPDPVGRASAPTKPDAAELGRQYARIYEAQAEAAELARRARAAEAVARLPSLARMLRAEFGASRVGYFGSLTTGRLHETSDVDIYVDRLAPGRYFDAVDRLWNALGRPVDLVELDHASPSLRARVCEDGVDVDD